MGATFGQARPIHQGSIPVLWIWMASVALGCTVGLRRARHLDPEAGACESVVASEARVGALWICHAPRMVFGLFKRKPKHVDEPDEVYMTRVRADQALLDAVRSAPRPVVVASFFSQSLARIGQLLASAGIAGEPLVAAGADVGERGVFLLDASDVATNYGFDAWLKRVDRELSFYFVEHYPVLRAEQTLIAVLEEASAQRPQHVRFFVGLDEPLMRAFGGERIVGLMQSMGMTANEAISHSLVDKSITNAQKKLDERVPNAVPAASDEEWFKINLG